MVQDLPPLTALRAFHAAGRLLSFQEAARELHVTPSAVSHQIRTLEDWLGVTLFTRGARRIELTVAGRKLLRETERSFSRIAMAANGLKRSAAARLKVSSLPLITSAWLIPRLAKFEAKHPDILLDIETSNRIADLERDGVDVAIRNLRAPTPGLVSRKLLDVRGVPVCAPDLLPTLNEPRDLASHTLIHVTARPGAWDEWLSSAGVNKLKPKREISFDTVPAALDAAARGRGVALGMHPLVWEAAIARDLVVPFSPPTKSGSSYYVVHRRADGARPEVRAFVDWLVKEMAAFTAKSGKVPARPKG
jgi:LysR family glycine cleavage system transcriptional activator